MTDRCINPTELQEGDLVAYLEGDASSAVVQHVRRCPTCLAEARSLNQVGQLLEQGLAHSELCVTMEQPATTQNAQWPAALTGWFKRPSPYWSSLLTAVAVCLMAVATAGVFTSSGFIPATPAPTVEVNRASDSPASDIAQEAAVPDFSPVLLRTEYQPVALVDSGSHSSLPIEHRIIRRKIVDIRLPPRVITEVPSEIAPPLDLRFELSGL